MYPPQLQTRQGILSGSDATFASHIANTIRVEEEVAWQSRLPPHLGNRSANEFQGTFHGPYKSGNTPPELRGSYTPTGDSGSFGPRMTSETRFQAITQSLPFRPARSLLCPSSNQQPVSDSECH